MDATDKAIHKVYKDIGQVRFRDYQSIGIDEHYYLWYYAENMLYILRDVMLDCLYFVEARSPKGALDIVKERCADAMKAGSYYEEVYEE